MFKNSKAEQKVNFLHISKASEVHHAFVFFIIFIFILLSAEAIKAKADSLSTNVTIVVSPPPGGGGGGGGSAPVSNPSVIFSGKAYPLSKVTILKDGQVAVTTISGPDANFYVSFSGLSSGTYNFALYSEDKNSVRSSLFSFPITVSSGTVVKVSGIFISPTISIDKNKVKRGDDIIIFGQSASDAEVTISVNSGQEFFEKVKAGKDGTYLHYFDTVALELGQHSAKSKAALNREASSYGKAVAFEVVGSLLEEGREEGAQYLKGDLNNDGKVNLIDFSIAAYWFKRQLNEDFTQIEMTDLSGDGKIDLTDFSIMAYYWTG